MTLSKAAGRALFSLSDHDRRTVFQAIDELARSEPGTGLQAVGSQRRHLRAGASRLIFTEGERDAYIVSITSIGQVRQ